MHGDGLKKRIRPVVSGTQQMRVRPNLRVKRTASGIEDAHNQPTNIAETNGISKRQTGVRLVGIFPYNFIKSAETSPFDNFRCANLQNIFEARIEHLHPCQSKSTE
jgi:hypothetical protein